MSFVKEVKQVLNEKKKLVEDQIAEHGCYGPYESWEEYLQAMTVSEFLFLVTDGELGSDMY